LLNLLADHKLLAAHKLLAVYKLMTGMLPVSRVEANIPSTSIKR